MTQCSINQTSWYTNIVSTPAIMPMPIAALAKANPNSHDNSIFPITLSGSVK